MPRSTTSYTDEACDICGATMSRRSDMPRHKKTHLGHRSSVAYKCTYQGCRYEGLQMSNYKTHLNTHTGEKPHSCQECGYKTNDPGCLTRHKKKIHGYIARPYRKKAQSTVTVKRETSSPSAAPVVLSEEPTRFSPDLSERASYEPHERTPESPPSSPLYNDDVQYPNQPPTHLVLEFFRTLDLASTSHTPATNTTEQLSASGHHVHNQFDAFLAQHYTNPNYFITASDSPSDAGLTTSPLEQTFPALDPWELHSQSTLDGSWLFPQVSQTSDVCMVDQSADCPPPAWGGLDNTSTSFSSSSLLFPNVPLTHLPPDYSYHLPSSLPPYHTF